MIDGGYVRARTNVTPSIVKLKIYCSFMSGLHELVFASTLIMLVRTLYSLD